MQKTAGDLLYFANCTSIYTQSDEISLFFPPIPENLSPPPPALFNLRVSKLVSLTASYASVRFVAHMVCQMDSKDPLLPLLYHCHFDARAYNLEEREMSENVLWRYEDTHKNGINNVGSMLLGHRSIIKKSPSEVVAMLRNSRDFFFHDEHPAYRFGSWVKKQKMTKEMEHPISKQMQVVERKKFGIFQILGFFHSNSTFLFKDLQLLI